MCKYFQSYRQLQNHHGCIVINIIKINNKDQETEFWQMRYAYWTNKYDFHLAKLEIGIVLESGEHQEELPSSFSQFTLRKFGLNIETHSRHQIVFIGIENNCNDFQKNFNKSKHHLLEKKLKRIVNIIDDIICSSDIHKNIKNNSKH